MNAAANGLRVAAVHEGYGPLADALVVLLAHKDVLLSELVSELVQRWG